MKVEMNGHWVIIDPTPEEERLLKLQAEWAIASPSARAAIQDSIIRNPDWGLVVRGGQIVEAEKNAQ